MASKVSSANGSRVASPAVQRQSGRRRLADPEHARGRSRRGRHRRRRPRTARRTCRAGREVQHLLAGRTSIASTTTCAPQPVLAERQDVVGQVVLSATSSNIEATSCGCLSRDARVTLPLSQMFGAPTNHALSRESAGRLSPPGPETRRRNAVVVLCHHDEHVPHLTVALDAETFPGGLPSFLVRDNVLCWTRREAGLVGFGEIARFTATGPERFLEADIWWRHLVLEADIEDAVDCPGTGPVAFGSFAFSKVSDHESRLLVPEIVVGLRDGQAWLTQLTFDNGELTAAGARAALERWLSPGSADGGSAISDYAVAGAAVVDPPAPGAALAGAAVARALPLAAEATLHTGSLSEEGWMAAVAAGVDEIRAGALEKLVLARDIVATVPTGVNAAQVLRELSARYRECWTYGVDGLVGATRRRC